MTREVRNNCRSYQEEPLLPKSLRILLLAPWIFVVFLPNSFREAEAVLYSIGGVIALLVVKRPLPPAFLVAGLGFTVIHSVGVLRNAWTAPDEAYIYNILTAYVAGPVYWVIYFRAVLAIFPIPTLCRWLSWAAVGVAAEIIVYYVFYDYIPSAVKEALVYEPNKTVIDGVAVVRLHAIGSLIFLLGFTSHFDTGNLLRQTLGWSLCCLAAVFTGRTGLLIGCAFAFIVVSGLRRRPKAFLAALIVGTLFVAVEKINLVKHDLDWANTFDDHIQKLISQGGEERPAQRAELLREFYEAPLLGKGHGLQTRVLRDTQKPWRYELFFEATLFRVGLLGLLLTVAPIFYGFLLLIRQTMINPTDSGRSGILAGGIALLTAGATNPYYEAVDFQWMIILPIVVSLIKDKTPSTAGNLRQRTPQLSLAR